MASLSSHGERLAGVGETEARLAAQGGRVEVVLNATSGADDKEVLSEQLEKLLAEHGIEAHVTLVRDGSKTSGVAERAVGSRCRMVVAGGGDGTINAVAAALVDTEVVLGVLPLGTLNHFAKDLRIPLDLEGAVRNLSEGHVESVDVGEVNGRVFLNNSSLGLYPSIVRSREQQQQRLGRGKWPAFVWAVVTVFRRYPFLNVRLEADGQRLVRRTPFVFVGNNEYQMESFQIGARACLDAGHLSLYVAHRTTRLGLLRLALRALFGRLREAKDFDALQAREIWIETRRPKRLRVATDGEVTPMQTPLHYRTRPRALRVVIPKAVTSDE